MNPRNTVLLVLLAGGLFAFLYFIEPRLHRPPPPPVRVVPGLVPDTVKQIELHLGEQPEIFLQRESNGWVITKPFIYPARAEVIENLLKAAAGLSPQTYVSPSELQGRVTVNSEYGFDKPQATIDFDQHPRLILGYFTAPGDQMYAQLAGEDGVNIIDADFFKKFVPHRLSDLRDLLFVDLNAFQYDKLTVSANAQTFTLQRDATNLFWRMNTPVRTRADFPKIDALLAALQKMNVAAFVTDDEKADLDSYGLQPPSLELGFDQGTNHVLSLQFGKSLTNNDNYLFARHGGDRTIVLVPRAAITNWLAGYQEFRDRHLVRLTRGLPDSIEVSGTGAENFTLRRQTNNLWWVASPANFQTDTNVMTDFLRRLAELQAVPVNGAVAVNDAVLPDDLPGYGLANPMRRYVLRLNPDNATATNTVEAELDFGLEKDGHVFARRADHPEETSVYAINAADFQGLPTNNMQLRPRRIWDFNEDDVTRITIRQDGKMRELVHKAPDQWSIAAGSGMINDLQVEIEAQELGLLEAANWVQRGDADRAKFGFTDKGFQISVQIKTNGIAQNLFFDVAEPSPRGIAPDGLRYGDVRTGDGTNWIFEVPAVVLDRLTTFLNIHENAVP